MTITIPGWTIPPIILAGFGVAAVIRSTRSRGNYDMSGGMLFLVGALLLVAALCWVVAYHVGRSS